MPLTTYGSVKSFFVQDLRPTESSILNQPGRTESQLSRFQSERQVGVSAINSQDSVRRLRGPYANSLQKERRGFILTSDLWMLEDKALVLHAGPAEVQWTIPMRASSEDIKGGRAHYAQSRETYGSSKTYFNLPTVQFTFQTGNILPIAVDNTVAETPYGLQDFYYFMQLVNQDPLIPEVESARGSDREGSHNYIWVFYTSLQFPQLVLRGYIEPEGLSWTDSAEAPNSFTWSAGMAVYSSTPEFWEADDLLSAYADFDFTLY